MNFGESKYYPWTEISISHLGIVIRIFSQHYLINHTFFKKVLY